MVNTFIKKAEEGNRYLVDIHKDTSELHEITKSFNRLMKNFQEANSELQRRVEEINDVVEALKARQIIGRWVCDWGN